MYYKHTLSSTSDVRAGEEAKIYCTVDLTAVIKERSGKTIRPSVLMDESTFLQKLVKAC